MVMEGSLSLPEISANIARSKSAIAHAQTLQSNNVKMKVGCMLSHVIQQEFDHLHGILFIDRMNSAVKAALSSRLKRLQNESRRGKRIRPEEEQSLVTETTL